MSDTPLQILGICGSLRHNSYNLALLKVMRDVAPPDVHLDIYEGLGDIPLYNEDLLAGGDPEPVLRLRAAVQACDILLIVTPEYNYGVPGLLKNALDWLSVSSLNERVLVLHNKAVGIMGTSSGAYGTARAQLSLRQTLQSMEAHVMPKPELMIPRAAEHFDADRKLTNQALTERLRRYIVALSRWATKINPA